jgi:methylglutaconyl-CoA hydratase
MGDADPVVVALGADGVARVTLNRPERRNAFDGALVAQLHSALRDLDRDNAVRAVVFTGAGDAFCAGADLAHMAAMAAASEDDNFADAHALATMLAALNALGKPTVARVNGDAFGGGIGLIACCDIAIAADTARFALTEVRLGLVPATISPYVVAAIGERWMRRLALTGERFDAARAVTIGLLHESVAANSLDAAVAATVADLLRGGPFAQREVKELVREVMAGPGGAALARATSHRLARLRTSQEARERIAQFLARSSSRTPSDR